MVMLGNGRRGIASLRCFAASPDFILCYRNVLRDVCSTELLSMGASIKSTTIKIVIWSLFIGLALSLAGVTPESLLSGLGSTVQRIFSVFVDMFRWAVPYTKLR